MSVDYASYCMDYRPPSDSVPEPRRTCGSATGRNHMEQYKHHPMVEAARNLDAIAEEHGFEHTLSELGLNAKAVIHVASQRAMRLVILSVRGPAALKRLNTGRPEPLSFSPAENAMIERFTLAVLDGLVIGWKGREIDIENNKEGEDRNE